LSRSTPAPGDRPDLLLLTCEHGGREVPAAYEHLFRGADAVLNTHRGYDIGALGVALRIASRLSNPIVFSTTTRLLIELNRSVGQPSLFSEFSRPLSEPERDQLVQTFYLPYRDSVTRIVSSAIATGHRVVHAGIHSFTDVFEDRPRELEIALLFDEDRPAEQAFCEHWQQAMQQRSTEYRYRFNEPYRGSDDGLTTALRAQFPADQYLGLEVEVRQGLLTSEAAQTAIGDLLSDGLAVATEDKSP